MKMASLPDMAMSHEPGKQMMMRIVTWLERR